MKYLIIGGGPCSDSAAKSIREYDKEGQIIIITKESYPPYRRMSLTKQVWKTGDTDAILLGTHKHNVEIHTNTTAKKINTFEKTVTTNNGDYTYDKLLITSGLTPRCLNFSDIHYFRTIDDFKSIYSRINETRNILLIGGGFTGLELASELKALGKSISMIFPESYVVDRLVPKEISEIIMSTFEKNNIKLITGDTVKDISNKQIITNNGLNLNADLIIASIGNIPNIKFLESSNIEITNGIKVNEYCETNIPDIYAAGDVAEFNSLLYKQCIRREFMDNALKQGKAAGANMTGNKTVYNPVLSTFFEALGLKYNAFGEYCSMMDMSLVWTNEKEAVIIYRLNNILKGILFWNKKPNTKVATNLIESKSQLNNEDIIAAIN